jgi:hypothetical protein
MLSTPTMKGSKMKTYKDTAEIERSEDFISWLVIEEFTIGNTQFFVRKYVLEDGDDVFNLFGVFTHHNAFTDSIEKKISPVFECKTECMRYAIELYNENYQHRYLNGKNCLGDSSQNSKRG